MKQWKGMKSPGDAGGSRPGHEGPYKECPLILASTTSIELAYCRVILSADLQVVDIVPMTEPEIVRFKEKRNS